MMQKDIDVVKEAVELLDYVDKLIKSSSLPMGERIHYADRVANMVTFLRQAWAHLQAYDDLISRLTLTLRQVVDSADNDIFTDAPEKQGSVEKLEKSLCLASTLLDRIATINNSVIQNWN